MGDVDTYSPEHLAACLGRWILRTYPTEGEMRKHFDRVGKKAGARARAFHREAVIGVLKRAAEEAKR